MDREHTKKVAQPFEINWYDVGQRIEAARDRAGFHSFSDLARCAGLSEKNDNIEGITRETKRTMSAEKLARIARACGVSLDWLIFGEQERKPEHDETWNTLRPYGESILHMVENLHANLSFRRYSLAENSLCHSSGIINPFAAFRYLSIDVPLYPYKATNEIFAEWNENGYTDFGKALQNFVNDICHAYTCRYSDIRNNEIKNAMNEYGNCATFYFPF